MTLTSSRHSHECIKEDCYFCYEQNRVNIDWYLPLAVPEILPFYSLKRWTGCERLVLMYLLNKPIIEINYIFPNRTVRALKSQKAVIRKMIPFNKFNYI